MVASEIVSLIVTVNAKVGAGFWELKVGVAAGGVIV
jgi:hypothetical protein